MAKTEAELFVDLEVLDEAERAVREQRLILEAECRAFGEMEGARGFRIDHLRIRHNLKATRERAMRGQM
jgi:hypothetical protein